VNGGSRLVAAVRRCPFIGSIVPGTAIERLGFDRQQRTLNVSIAVEAGAACSTPIRSPAAHASVREVSQARCDISAAV